MDREAKKITIKDIAAKANVSGTTVSRYLNGKYEYMSSDTKEKIEKVIEEVGYRPNNIARTLKSNKSRLIGAVIADIENPFSNRIIKGLTDKANERGYSLIISISNNSLEKENASIERFLDNQVEGLIVNTVGGNEAALKRIHQFLPVVLIDRNVSNFKADVVTSNNYDLGLQLMEHLFENKYRSICFFSEKVEKNSVRSIRYQAFSDTAQLQPQIQSKTYIIERENIKEIEGFLDEFHHFPSPRAVVAGNGLVQLSVLKAMKEKGYSFDDFSLCGYDDWDWTPLIGEGGITTLSQNSYKLGSQAMEILIDRIEGTLQTEEKLEIQIPGELIIRDSTKKRN